MSTPTALATPGAPQRSRWREAWRGYARDPRGLAGLVMLTTALIVAVVAPLLTDYSPSAIAGRPLQPPGDAHWFGTDHLGRDIFARVVYGTQISMAFAFGAAAISFFVGTLLGALSGYFGGLVDHLLSRVFEFFLMIPMLFLVILMSALLGANIYVAAFVVGITIWPSNARIVRAQVLSLKRRAYVRAARAGGASHLRILFRHILPNGIQPVVVNSTLQVGAAILLEASLSFLGLGDANFPSWGQMLRDAQPFLAVQWTYAVFPGLAIAWLVIAVTLVGDGINASLNRGSR